MGSIEDEAWRRVDEQIKMQQGVIDLPQVPEKTVLGAPAHLVLNGGDRMLEIHPDTREVWFHTRYADGSERHLFAPLLTTSDGLHHIQIKWSDRFRAMNLVSDGYVGIEMKRKGNKMVGRVMQEPIPDH